MKQKQRFGLEEVERQRKVIEDAKKPAPPPTDNMSNIGRLLVNLPWALLMIAFVIWWLKK